MRAAAPGRRRAADGGVGGHQVLASVGAIGVIILGAAPMAITQASPVANTILAQSIDGSGQNPVNSPAPALACMNRDSQAVALASLRRQGGAADQLPGRHRPRWTAR